MTAAKDLILLSDTCEQYAVSAERDISDRQNDPRTMSLWNIRNRVRMSAEILTFYERYWNSGSFPEVGEDLEGELVERIMTVTRDLFVDVVSAVEKAVKDCVKIYSASGLKEDALKMGSHLYLRNIIECSYRRGLIGKDTFGVWDDILTVRNLAAHNNSVSDRNRRCTIGGVTISMRAGRMMKGPLNTFISLTATAVDLFYDWLVMMDSRF